MGGLYLAFQPLLDFAAQNSWAIPALFAFAAAKVPLAAGITYTRPDHLLESRRKYDLPETLTTDITRPLAKRIAVPFGNKFKALIAKMAQDREDPRIVSAVSFDSPEIDDLAVEDVLFGMIRDICKGKKYFERTDFTNGYDIVLARRMKETYFAEQPITEVELRSTIQGLKIRDGMSIAELLTEWVKENGILDDAICLSFGPSALKGDDW